VTINWPSVAVVAVTVFVAALAAWGVILGVTALWQRRTVRRARKRQGWPESKPAPSHARPPAQEPVSFGDHATQAVRVARKPTGRALLASPPTIDGVTLRDYLVHHATRACPHMNEHGRPEHAGTWPCVVEDLYVTALDSTLAHYFDDVDLSPLKRHMLSALVTLTNVGLTVDLAGRLQLQHAHLGITQADFDLVVHVLIDSIGAYTTPAVMEHVLPQLTPAVVELKKRLVTA
jgi:hypothetical protein